jgi:hypothetical protein
MVAWLSAHWVLKGDGQRAVSTHTDAIRKCTRQRENDHVVNEQIPRSGPKQNISSTRKGRTCAR